jgi:Arc/MetJ family transcription regulator
MNFDIDIEPEMIAEVMEITGADTLNEAVEMTLRHLIFLTDPTAAEARVLVRKQSRT